MTVTEKRLVGPTQLGVTGTAESSLCSPASGSAVKLTYIKATNNDAAATHYLCVSIGADAAATRIVDQYAIPANDEYERWIAWVLSSSDILCASADTASKITLTLNGKLTTVP